MKSEQEMTAKIVTKGWTVVSSDAGVIRFKLPGSEFGYSVGAIEADFRGDGWSVRRLDGNTFSALRRAEPAPVAMRKITPHKGGRTETTTIRMTEDVARMAQALREEHGLSMADLLEAAVKQKTYELRK